MMFSNAPVCPIEYAICQRRGHEAQSTSIQQGNKTHYQCKWCHVGYWWEVNKILHETNPPVPEGRADGS